MRNKLILIVLFLSITGCDQLQNQLAGSKKDASCSADWILKSLSDHYHKVYLNDESLVSTSFKYIATEESNKDTQAKKCSARFYAKINEGAVTRDKNLIAKSKEFLESLENEKEEFLPKTLSLDMEKNLNEIAKISKIQNPDYSEKESPVRYEVKIDEKDKTPFISYGTEFTLTSEVSKNVLDRIKNEEVIYQNIQSLKTYLDNYKKEIQIVKLKNDLPIKEKEVVVEVKNNNLLFSPSFNCTKATLITELTICRNETLAKLDVKNSEVYKLALKVDMIRAKEVLKLSNQDRRVCKDDVECIRLNYQDSITNYEKIVKDGNLANNS
jgi:hypothetical protein